MRASGFLVVGIWRTRTRFILIHLSPPASCFYFLFLPPHFSLIYVNASASVIKVGLDFI